MNKLVSRNPVLRFKEGRKIIKAEEGAVARWQRRIKHPIDAYINLDKRIPNPFVWMDNQLKKIGNSLVVENYTPENGGTTNNKLRNRLLNNLNIVKQNTYKTPELTGSKEAYLNRLQQQGFTAKETPVKTKKAISAPKNNPPIASGFIKGYLNTDDIQNVVNQYGGIKGFQQFLIDNKFLSGDRSKKEGADGWWGDNTQKAYEAWKASLGSSPEVTNYVASLVPDALKPQQDLSNSGSLPTIQEQMLALTNNYTLTPELKATSNWLLLDKSGTRNWMKNTLNLSPYKYTGALRAGVRRIAGGLGTEEDKNLILLNPEVYEALKKAGYWRFKQGGNLLPSKNIVERFKQRNFR